MNIVMHLRIISSSQTMFAASVHTLPVPRVLPCGAGTTDHTDNRWHSAETHADDNKDQFSSVGNLSLPASLSHNRPTPAREPRPNRGQPLQRVTLIRKPLSLLFCLLAGHTRFFP